MPSRQDGIPAFGVEVAHMLRAHPHALRCVFVKDFDRNALHQCRRQVQRPQKAYALVNPVEVDGGWRQCGCSRPGKNGYARPLTRIEKFVEIKFLIVRQPTSQSPVSDADTAPDRHMNNGFERRALWQENSSTPQFLHHQRLLTRLHTAFSRLSRIGLDCMSPEVESRG